MKTLRHQRKARRNKNIESIPISGYLFSLLHHHKAVTEATDPSLPLPRVLVLDANTRNEYCFYIPETCFACGYKLSIVRDTSLYNRPLCTRCHRTIWSGLHCPNPDNAYFLTWAQGKLRFTRYSHLPQLQKVSHPPQVTFLNDYL